VIGTTHDASYELFPIGKMAPAGLEHSAERAHQPLDAEIRAAIAMARGV
jgi:hypothetical protein